MGNQEDGSNGTLKELAEIDTPILLYVGNLVHVKGADVLIEAFAELVNGYRLSVIGCRTEEDTMRHAPCAVPPPQHSDTPIHPYSHTTELMKNMPMLFIIGSGSMKKKLIKQAKKLGVSDCVHFLGSRPHEEVALWMNVADFLCLPSRSEGMPNVVVEALASGLPVVATSVGEVPFLVEEGRNGFVVDAAEVDVVGRFADAMGKAIRMEWDREKIAAGVKDYTWEKAAGVILERIEEGMRAET